MSDDRAPIELEKLAFLIRRAIYAANGAILIGASIPVTNNYAARMRSPQVGDLVIEASTVYRSRGTTDLDAVGILEEVATEKVDFTTGDPEFVWDEAIEGSPHPTETVYYIRTLDGRRFRWTNATIIAAPLAD